MLFILAWRNIWRNKMRSAVVIISVIIGLWAGAMIMGVESGMAEQRQNDAIQNEVSHIQIHLKEFKTDKEPVFVIPETERVIAAISKSENVKAVSGRLVTMGMILTASNSAGVKINGVVPEDEAKIIGLDRKIVAGNFFVPEKLNQILIGDRLADKMKLKVKSRIVLTFSDKVGNVVSGSFRVAGIFNTDNIAIDEAVVYTRIQDMSSLLLTEKNVHEIAILLTGNEKLEFEVAKIKGEFPTLIVESWREVAPEIGLLIDMVAVLTKVIMIVILFALAFGIINTMLMAMLERTREIGMMMALGLNKLKLFLLVLFETAILVLIGCPFGLLLSYGVINIYAKRGINLGAYGNALETLGLSNIIYPKVELRQYEQIIFLVIITALIASIFPARKALRIQPAESIKI